MSKKSTTNRTNTPLKRPSTRSLTSTQNNKTPSTTIEKDKYTFQSDDEDHQNKPILTRSTPSTGPTGKRGRGRPPAKAKNEEKNLRRSLSSSNIESDSSPEETSTNKGKTTGKSSLEKTKKKKRSF